MSATVWDQEFFRRRAAGEQAAGGPEPAAATPLAPGHATIAGLLLARADDDNTALLFEDQRWSWRELVQEAATRSALMQQLRPHDRPWHIGVLLENTPEYCHWSAATFTVKDR
jgi:fatty-acyl-CoA synthase